MWFNEITIFSPTLVSCFHVNFPFASKWRGPARDWWLPHESQTNTETECTIRVERNDTSLVDVVLGGDGDAWSLHGKCSRKIIIIIELCVRSHLVVGKFLSVGRCTQNDTSFETERGKYDCLWRHSDGCGDANGSKRDGRTIITRNEAKAKIFTLEAAGNWFFRCDKLRCARLWRLFGTNWIWMSNACVTIGSFWLRGKCRRFFFW